MVQYVLTPWRDRQELLLVRQQFYGGRGTPSWLGGAAVSADDHERPRQRERRHQAVARVSMWMQRGNCPHMVESTALLAAAVLSDEEEQQREGEGCAGHAVSSAAYAARAAYAAAFSRFVTGLLDGQQDKQRKQSMYALAKTIGLPATFVELRHQATHEQLPSLAKLRSAARKALQWIWEYYWQHLGPDAGEETTCEDAVLRYLLEDHDDGDRGLQELSRRFGRGTVLGCLVGLQGRLPGNQAYLKCLRLSRELTEHDGKPKKEETPAGAQQRRRQASAGELPDLGQTLEADTGWSLYEGPWKPKPIGIV